MKYVSYFRVSTAKQGTSGLGLEAQQKAVSSFIGSNDSIIQSFIEIESGKNNQRTELLKAIGECKATGATLLVAKLDRLSRNIQFIFNLRESGVDFKCVDLPDFNTLTLGMFAVIAQHERETISKRTKDALQAKKARGEKVGNVSNFTANKELAIEKSKATRKAKALSNNNTKLAGSKAKDLKKNGLSLRAIAAELNTDGFVTAKGKQYTAIQVSRLLA